MGGQDFTSNLGLGFVKLAIEFYYHDHKFGPNEVFTTREEEDLGNPYNLNVIAQTNNSEDEAEVAIDLLNIAGTFQRVVIVTRTKVECPFSPTPCYYVEMPCNLVAPTTNLELIVNLEDPCLESDDLNVSYQTQQVHALANLLSLPRLPKKKTLGKESLIDYFSSHVMTFDQYLVVFKQKAMDKEAMDKMKELKIKKKREKKKGFKIHLP
jgi:hypothetical protein